MKTIYEMAGILNKGFVGQISYVICLDKKYNEMDIEFSFDKQHYSQINNELKEDIVCEYGDEYTDIITRDDRLVNAIRDMKTEIHTIVTMNDNFIGGVHKQLTDRHMFFSALEASNGCIPQKSIDGVIKVTLVVFNVLLDDTHYKLTLSVN